MLPKLKADPRITYCILLENMQSKIGHRRVQEVLKSYVNQGQLWSSHYISDPRKWNIPATNIEFGDFASTSDVDGELLGKWLDSDVVIKLWVSSSDRADAFEDQVDRWFSLRHTHTSRNCTGLG